MIDINLLESAKLIKIEFNRVQKELLTYESDIKSLIDFLSEKIEVLQKFNKESEKPGFTREDLDKKIKFLIDEIVQIEIEEKKIS